MTLLGLSAVTVTSLFVLGGAVLVALYLLRLQRRRVEVPFASLWQQVVAEKEMTSWLRRLSRWLSLLIQLLILACLVLALGEPHFGASRGRHIVVLLDASGSMQATDVAPSRMARGRREVLRLLDASDVADSWLVVRMGVSPEPLGTWGTDVLTLRRRIAAVEAGDTEANVVRALAFADDALRGRENGQIVLVGDGRWQDGALARIERSERIVRFIPVGGRRDNIAITAFAGRRRHADRRRFDLFLEVESFRKESTSITVEILSGKNLMDRRTLSLGAGQKARHSYSDLTESGGVFEARLLLPPGSDDLAADNRALTLVPERRQRRVLLVTDGNLFLEGALLADSEVDLDRVTPGELSSVARTYDIVVLDRVAPTALPAAMGILRIDPPLSVERDRIRNPILTEVDEGHAVTRNLLLRDLNIHHGKRLPVQPGEVVLAASLGAPVITAKESHPRTVTVGFDVRQSDLPLRTAFPLFMANVLDWFVADSLESPNVRTGTTLHIPVVSDAGAKVVSPSGEIRTLPIVNDRIAVWVDEAGLWRAGSTQFSARFSPVESVIEPRTALPGADNGNVSRGWMARTGGRPWTLLVLLAIFLLMVEWFTYHRRVTA